MRRYSVSLESGARRELERERRYYDRAAGLGHDFIAEVDAGLASLRRMPEANSVADTWRGEVVRRALLDRFPFKLLYVVRGRRVLVLALAHTRQRPGSWKKRLKG